MPTHYLVYDDVLDFIAVHTVAIVEELDFHDYAYIFYPTKEVPSTLPEVYSAGVYVRDGQVVTRVVCKESN